MAADISTEPVAAQLLFIATIFVASCLLFLMQPTVAWMALPRLGGAPAAWNNAMLNHLRNICAAEDHAIEAASEEHVL